MEEPLIPIPPDAGSVLVFGGTFDPPTIAHRDLPPRVRDAINADWLLYIPAARSPHKDELPGASAEHRLAMLRAMVADMPRAAVSPIELQRAQLGPSYTIDTLRALRAEFPKATLRLLIGADQAAAFHRWREPRDIIALAQPVVMLRAPAESWDQLSRQMASHWTAAELRQWGGWVAPVPTINARATQARAILRAFGPDDPRLPGMLPAPVLRHIRCEGLYRP